MPQILPPQTIARPIGSAEGARARDARGRPLLESPSDWAGPPIDLLQIPGSFECGPGFTREPLLQVALSGTGRRWLGVGRQEVEACTHPRTVVTYAAGFERSRARWMGTAGVSVAIRFPASLTKPLLQEDSAFHLETRLEALDERVCHFAFTLAEEARQGMPTGPLYVQGLTLALIGLFSRPMPVRSAAGGLSWRQRRLICELIEAELGQPLHVERMAGAVGLSPFQFSRRFKVTFGVSPHRYVLRRRIEAAHLALRLRPDMPIADVAFAYGFSSQAHFTDAFRRQLGMTPAHARTVAACGAAAS